LEAAEEELRRDRAEAIRVAYIAATRARDIRRPGEGSIEGWLDVLRPVLYPPSDAWRNSEAAVGCPSFGEGSVADRGPMISACRGSVQPGLHRPTGGPSGTDRPPVVWWDPTTLVLEVEEQLVPKRNLT
jgi:ATP-dependent helicase/nuclease subunit A